MREKIIKVLAEMLTISESELLDTTVISEISGFDSLRFVMLISELQEKYQIDIPLDQAIQVKTIGELVACAKSM